MQVRCRYARRKPGPAAFRRRPRPDPSPDPSLDPNPDPNPDPSPNRRPKPGPNPNRGPNPLASPSRPPSSRRARRRRRPRGRHRRASRHRRRGHRHHGLRPTPIRSRQTIASSATAPTAACFNLMRPIMRQKPIRCTARNDLLQDLHVVRDGPSVAWRPSVSALRLRRSKRARGPKAVRRLTICARPGGAELQVKIDIFNHVMPAALPRADEAALEGRRPGEAHVFPAHALGHRRPRRDARREVPGRTAGPDALAAAAGGARRARARAGARARRERRHGRDLPPLAGALPGVRRVAADEQRAGGARRDGPRDRGPRRARHPDLHQRGGAAARRAGVLPGVRAGDEPPRRPDLDASGATRRLRRLPHRAEVEVRDLAGARLAVRDERRHGAHRLLRAPRAAAERPHHHPPLRRA